MPAPQGAKKPADRKPKATAEVDDFALSIRGVDVVIPAAALDDFELMEDIGRVDDGDLSRAPMALRRLVGPESMRALMDAARDPETGRVSSEAGAALFLELFQAIQEQVPNS